MSSFYSRDLIVCDEAKDKTGRLSIVVASLETKRRVTKINSINGRYQWLNSDSTIPTYLSNTLYIRSFRKYRICASALPQKSDITPQVCHVAIFRNVD